LHGKDKNSRILKFKLPEFANPRKIRETFKKLLPIEEKRKTNIYYKKKCQEQISKNYLMQVYTSATLRENGILRWLPISSWRRMGYTL